MGLLGSCVSAKTPRELESRNFLIKLSELKISF
jgi:hypothetical protein